MDNAINAGYAHSTVLMIEDDQSVRKMLRFSVQTAGFDVAEVATGDEALRFLEQHPPDAVILDLGLPDGLGKAVLDRLLLLDQGTDNPPVWVVMSALDRGDATRQYGPVGNHFLFKPFDPWDMVRTLEELLSAKGDHSA